MTVEDQADISVKAAPAPNVDGDGTRPRITVKIAQTLDGRIATRTGQSQWITSAPARALAHELRATHDAVLVGIGTVLQDNPRLTVRLVEGPDPLRVVADSTLRIPLDSHLLVEQPETTICVAGEAASPERCRAIRERGARVVVGRTLQDGEGGLDLADALQRLGGLGIQSVMVEGGSGIVTSLLRAGLVDRVVVCIAPKILGAGLDAVGDLGIRDLAQALTFRTTTVRQLGPDIFFDGQVERAPAGGNGPD